MRERQDEEWFFFDAAERTLVREVLTAVSTSSPRQCAALVAMLGRLRKAAELVRDCPSIASSWDVAGERAFTADSLIDQLCRIPDYDLDLHVPTKAVFGQAYLIAKINLLKAVGYTLASAPVHHDGLAGRVEREIGQSIYSKLAEELFVSVVTDATAPLQVKKGAARFLFRIWEDRLHVEVDDFAPLLESAWEARAKLLPVLGTMLGTHEVFRLFREARDKRLFDYFGEDDVEEDELLAFEELLFGLSHEEVVRLRAHMAEEGRACISMDAARALLGDTTRQAPRHRSAAQAIYTSYKQRRRNAVHRAVTGASGPKKTAEEYVMIAFLKAEASPPGG